MNLAILKLLLQNRETHNKYGRFIKEYVEQQDSKELKQIVNAIDLLYDQHQEAESFTTSDLDIMLSKAYPNQPKTLLEPILERINSESANHELLKDYLDDLALRKKAHQIAVQALSVYETGNGVENLLSSLKAIEESGNSLEGDTEDEFVSNDIESLIVELESEPGLNWRLKELNELFGPLRKGDFGFLFARPESGKTTFLASEVSFMAGQLDRAVLWINNEEESRQVMRRVTQAALGVTNEQLVANIAKCSELFLKKTKNNIKINTGGAPTKRQIEAWCKQMNPGLIIMDQIDKIQGFEDERHDLKLKQIYFWARELSKQYGPVIAVCQAGGTGENKKWLTMNDVDSSHTSKQGEASWVLGIGKLHDEQYERVRFLHASKNKLTGKHGKVEVLIKPEVARYESLR